MTGADSTSPRRTLRRPIRPERERLVEGTYSHRVTRLLSKPSGFVLRLYIQKADEVWGKATLGHGLADTRVFTRSTVVDRSRLVTPGRNRAGADGNFTHVGRIARPCIPRPGAAWYIGQSFTKHDRAYLVSSGSLCSGVGTDRFSAEELPQ